MINCIFLSDQESFLVRAEEEAELEEVMQEWVEDYKSYIGARTEAYVEAYRTTLDIPMDATLDEERDMVIERFGDNPMGNEEFVRLTDASKDKYEELRPPVPVWEAWFEERGFEIMPVTHIIDARDE